MPGIACRACDACRAWDACRACDACGGPRRAQAGRRGAPRRRAAAPPGTVPKSAIMPGICTMPCVPRLPARPAVPTILVVPSLAVGALARSLPSRLAVDRCQRGPRHGRTTRPGLDLGQDPGRLARRPSRPRRGTVGCDRFPRLTALSSWPLLTKPVTPCAASEPVNVCALTDRFGAESPPIVRSAPGRIAGDHLDMAVEQDPVAGPWLVAVAQRMPAVMGLGVLHDRDDLRRARVEVDAHVGPLAQRPRIGGSAGNPALLAGGLSAEREREAGEGGAGLTVVSAVHAVDSPDERLHLGRALRLRHAKVVLRHLDDGRPQRAVAGLLGLGRLGGLVHGHQLHRHPGRRRHLVDRSVSEGEPGHRTARAEADQRGCLLPRRLGLRAPDSLLGRLPAGLMTARRLLVCSVSGSLPHVGHRLEDRLDLRVPRIAGVGEQHARRRRPRQRWRLPPTAGTCQRPVPPARSRWLPAARTGSGIPGARRRPTIRCT